MDENKKNSEIISEAEEAEILSEIEETSQNNVPADEIKSDESSLNAQNPSSEDVPFNEPQSFSETSDSDDIFEETDIFEEESLDQEDSAGQSFFKKHMKALIITAAVIVVIIAAYIALCAVTKSKDTILNNVNVDGVDISQLTVEAAAAALESELSQSLSDSTIQVMALDEVYTVSLSSVLDTDWVEMAQECYDYGHSSFITSGWCFIVSLFSEKEFESTPYAAYEEELSSALEEAGLTALSSVVESTYSIEDDSIVLTLGTTGLTPDIDALCDLIFAAITAADYETVIECPMQDDEPQDLDLEAIYDEVYVEPENATLDPDNDYSIVESITGVSFDIDEAQSSVDSASEGESVTIELVYTEPDIDTENLEENLFKDTLGTYTTSVSGTSARRSNVKLASESCEVILLPGETFSYNDTVGERTTARGYQAAAAYLNGATVQEVGGGVCQVSSTLYVACLYANLEIVERSAHTYASSYVPLGWDATVSWGGPDFKFTNNTNYPIKIEAEYSSNNKLTMSIIGTDENGYTVKIVSETYSTISYETEEIEDDTLEVGTTVVEQSGYTGYKVQTWRYVYDSDGNLISSDEEAYSSYSKRNKIVRVGTKVTETEDEDADEDEGEDENSE